MHVFLKRTWLSLVTVLFFQFAHEGLMAANFTHARVNIMQPPNSVEVVLADHTATLSNSKAGEWTGNGVEVTISTNADGVVRLKAPGAPVKKVHLHWAAVFDTNALVLGDAWERAYGDLEWKPAYKTETMPWYFLVTDGAATDSYGVMTGPAAMCYWKVGDHGIDLWADVRSGGVGVELGNRTLTVCTITVRQGHAGESSFDAACAFCRQMCPHPRIPAQPVYGFNDWYCAYGANTADAFLKDAKYVASLSPTKENEPFMVIDDGWQANRQGGTELGNPWRNTNAKFGSTMPDIARTVKAMNARPGLWYRPLQAWTNCPMSWRLAGRPEVLDPSNPEVLKDITQNIKRFRDWGYGADQA